MTGQPHSRDLNERTIGKDRSEPLSLIEWILAAVVALVLGVSAYGLVAAVVAVLG